MTTSAIEIVPVFRAFPSIPRLFRDYIVTEKIDGTNASVHVLEDGTVLAGSRTRYITPENDNAGFARFVAEREEQFRALLGPGQHFGEWYGNGIQRGYGLPEKRFALFNTTRWTGVELPERVGVVPVLAICGIEMVKLVADSLYISGSLIAPGFAFPEGIVTFHTKSGQLAKYTFDKNDGHKSA